jgi:hypothetical protein
MDKHSLDAMVRTVLHLLETRTSVNGRAKRTYDELLKLACRKVDEIAPVNVSKAARAEATKRNLEDLRNYCWHCPIMGTHKDGTKRLFLWEHYKPVADIKNELLRLGPSPRPNQVSVILAKTRIVWVLRREGNALGDKSRPDPARTYRDAGVELCHSWEDCAPIACNRH